MAAPLQNFIASNPEAEHLRYVDDIVAFYRTCDAVVIPMLDEGGPQLTYEMAAAGKAMIATPMAKARMLKHRENALIVPEHDPDAICEALEELSSDTELRARLGARAKKDAALFGYKTVVQKRAALLLDAVNRALNCP